MHFVRQSGAQPYRRTYENSGQFDDESCEKTIVVIGAFVIPIFVILTSYWLMSNSTKI